MKYLSNPEAPFTGEELAATEKMLGRKIPTAYLEFLRQGNGGLPEKYAFLDAVERMAIP